MLASGVLYHTTMCAVICGALWAAWQAPRRAPSHPLPTRSPSEDDNGGGRGARGTGLSLGRPQRACGSTMVQDSARNISAHPAGSGVHAAAAVAEFAVWKEAKCHPWRTTPAAAPPTRFRDGRQPPPYTLTAAAAASAAAGCARWRCHSRHRAIASCLAGGVARRRRSAGYGDAMLDGRARPRGISPQPRSAGVFFHAANRGVCAAPHRSRPAPPVHRGRH